MKKSIFYFSVFVLFVISHSVKAQSCGTCSLSINQYDVASYTVNVGQTLCIDTLGNYEGDITLNGGTVCVKGMFKPKTLTFTSGNITNYGNTSLPVLPSLSSGKLIENKSDAVLNISQGITISGGSFINIGICNIQQNITNTSGTLTNTGILNCVQVTGSNAFTNTGVLNTN
jgi:hypothetical protein